MAGIVLGDIGHHLGVCDFGLVLILRVGPGFAAFFSIFAFSPAAIYERRSKSNVAG